ncbi:hypothetical protein [Clostridium sp.]
MFTDSPFFIFYLEEIVLINNTIDENLKTFINNYPPNICYFFSTNCSISRKEIFDLLSYHGVFSNFNNILTPTYLLMQYCKDLYKNFSIHPITNSLDFNDFFSLNIQIKHENPSAILISTTNITDENLFFIESHKIPIVMSSNLCLYNRSLNCSNCFRECSIRRIVTHHKDGLIVPDRSPVYASGLLFKQLNISPKHTIVFTDILRDDYIQYQRMGCTLILTLNNRTTLEDYLKSPDDADLVISDFEKLSYFLKLKKD